MLLQDCPSKKILGYFREYISKGELIRATKSYQWMIADSSPPVIVDCQWDQLQLVDRPFIPYLLAVENLSSRHNLFIKNRNYLTKCVMLNPDDKVDVMLEKCDIPSTAVIKYKGELPNKKGIYFGVEVLVSQ